jgi:hypothetical protein
LLTSYYKYLKKEHLDEFKTKGVIKITTLQDLRTAEAKEVRDPFEGIQKVTAIPAYQPIILSDNQIDQWFPMIQCYTDKQGAHLNKPITSLNTIRNMHVFCVSRVFDPSLREEFGGSFYKIVHPYLFARIICRKIFEITNDPIRCWGADVMYADKEYFFNENNVSEVLSKINNDPIDICLTKSPKFSGQKEFRFLFESKEAKEIHTLIIKAPELLKCCEFEEGKAV